MTCSLYVVVIITFSNLLANFLIAFFKDRACLLALGSRKSTVNGKIQVMSLKYIRRFHGQRMSSSQLDVDYLCLFLLLAL